MRDDGRLVLMTTACGDVFECLHLGWIQQTLALGKRWLDGFSKPWLLGRDGWCHGWGVISSAMDSSCGHNDGEIRIIVNNT